MLRHFNDEMLQSNKITTYNKSTILYFKLIKMSQKMRFVHTTLNDIYRNSKNMY